jgi:hypothetical protein
LYCSNEDVVELNRIIPATAVGCCPVVPLGNVNAPVLFKVTFWLASTVTAVVPAVCRARIPEASAVWIKPPDPELLALIVVVMG